ncbi:MAG: phosphatase PAP2 family protein [Verrucomicrobia bacterium]|nr:phosphatase PAP2 family protein [Verrucomicrobiota bacterium]
MSWLESIDIALFRGVNQGTSNPVFDVIMPWLAGNGEFLPGVIILAVYLLWRGGLKGRIFAFLTVLTLALVDSGVINMLKDGFERPRPFSTLDSVNLLVGMGGSGSFPSSHASNWFAGTVLCYAFYPTAARWVLAIGCLVAFSRVYVGVHYPSDVLAGAILGAGGAIGVLWGISRLWSGMTLRWVPEIHERLPSLLPVAEGTDRQLRGTPGLKPLSDQAWVRVAYGMIAVLLFLRLGYLALGKIELSEDEAYQWLWSKHPALSYFSKPPMIAWLHSLGTGIWGDTMFGSRFASPVMAALLSVVVARFMAREVSGKAAFWLVALVNVVPLLVVGSILITVDPAMVLFWMLAMVMGWRALQPDGTTAQWCWTGLLIGCSSLAKYAGLYQLVSWVLVFLALPEARKHLRRPGPWIGLGIALSCLIPVILWNAANQWITVEHVRFNASRGGTPWSPTSRFLIDFLVSEIGLLNPVLFAAMAIAVFRFRRITSHPALARFLFWMGAPVFFGYLAFTAYKRVLPNWIAPSVVPLLCLSVLYWHEQHLRKSLWPRRLLLGAIGLGLPLVILLHDTRLITKISGRSLPTKLDPMRRVTGWQETAEMVDAARRKLALDGKDVFLIGNHYGITSQLAWHIPEARLDPKHRPLVYFRSARSPENQFFFWKSYVSSRRGQNAVFVMEVDLPRNLTPSGQPQDLEVAAQLPPSSLVSEFGSVTSLGVFPVVCKGRVLRYLQLFECRDLKPLG